MFAAGEKQEEINTGLKEIHPLAANWPGGCK